MAGLGRGEGDFHGLAVANFADEDDFGAWRNAERRPAAKVGEIPAQFALGEGGLECGCRNSMGSSRVTMCILECWFSSLSIAARVVVLPLPVAPVTKMMPVFSLMISLKTGCSFKPLAGGDLRC